MTTGVNTIDFYPWQDVFYDDDLATGANDGTSEANAWQSLADLSAGVKPMMRVNMKKTAAPITLGADYFFTAGGTSGMIYYRGYGTNIGDGTKWIGNATSTFNFESGSGPQLFQDLSFTGDNTGGGIFRVAVDPQTWFYRCSFSSSTTSPALGGNGECCLIECDLINTGTFVSSGYEAWNCTSGGGAIGCTFEAEGVVVKSRQVGEGDSFFMMGCIVISASGETEHCIEMDGTQPESSQRCVMQCSTFGGARGISYRDMPVSPEYGNLIAWNICSGCDEGIGVLDTVNIEIPNCYKNALGANTTNDEDPSLVNWLDLWDNISLSGSPYADTALLDLDNTAGEGALCRSAADIGYVGGSGTEQVLGAFTIGGWREGVDDGGDPDPIIAASDAGGAGVAGFYAGILPITKSSELT